MKRTKTVQAYNILKTDACGCSEGVCTYVYEIDNHYEMLLVSCCSTASISITEDT